MTISYQLILIYLHSECPGKYELNYVQNMIENMISTSYSDMSYLVVRRGGHVASIQMMSYGKLKHHVSRQFLSPNVTLMMHRRVP